LDHLIWLSIKVLSSIHALEEENSLKRPTSDEEEQSDVIKVKIDNISWM